MVFFSVPLRGPTEGCDTSQDTVRKDKLKDFLKNLLLDHNSKCDMSRHELKRQLSDIVNRADRNMDNEISLPEFLEIMKDIVRKTDTDCCIWGSQYLPLSGHFCSQNNLLLITGEEPQDRC